MPVFAADTQTVNGWVSDSKCGVKGAHEGAAECTKKCIAAGANMVVVTDGEQKVLTVENPDALKGHEGHHIAVTGHVERANTDARRHGPRGLRNIDEFRHEPFLGRTTCKRSRRVEL